jgi:outer membrane protein assembly factor BamB
MDPERGLVYVGHEGEVSAVRISDGRTRWTAEVGARVLALHDKTVYVGERQGTSTTLRALDPADGGIRWEARFDDPSLSSPRFADGRLYLETSRETETVRHPIGDDRADLETNQDEIGRIEARDPNTGDLLWTVEDEAQLRIESISAGTVVVRAVPRDWIRDDEAIYALDGTTGDVRWNRVDDAPTDTRAPGTLVYCSHPDDQIVRARDPVDGTVVWDRRGDVGPAARAALDGTVVFTRQSGILAIDEETGEVRWRHDVGDLPQPVDAVIDPDRHIAYAAVRDSPSYVSGGSTSRPESTTIVARDLESGDRLWARTCPYYDSSRLALGEDTVFVRSWTGQSVASGVVALDASTGAIQFRSAIDGTRLATPPQIDDGPTLVVADDSDDGDRSLRLRALLPEDRQSSRSSDRSSESAHEPPVSASGRVGSVAGITVDHAETIAVGVVLDPSSPAPRIELSAGDGARSRTLTETALTGQADGARLLTASIERSSLDFRPDLCTVHSGQDSISVEVS